MNQKFYVYDINWTEEVYGPFWSYEAAEAWGWELLKSRDPDANEDSYALDDYMRIIAPLEPGVNNTPGRLIEQVS